MLFTRECDYAIRIMRALSNGGIISVSDISELEQITSAITYKLARKLEKSGLIKSHRGINGGYSINCKLEETTLYDVCSSIDQDLFLVECMKPEYRCEMNKRTRPCAVHNEFCRIQGLLVEQLKEKNLAELFNCSR